MKMLLVDYLDYLSRRAMHNMGFGGQNPWRFPKCLNGGLVSTSIEVMDIFMPTITPCPRTAMLVEHLPP